MKAKKFRTQIRKIMDMNLLPVQDIDTNIELSDKQVLVKLNNALSSYHNLCRESSYISRKGKVRVLPSAILLLAHKKNAEAAKSEKVQPVQLPLEEKQPPIEDLLKLNTDLGLPVGYKVHDGVVGTSLNNLSEITWRVTRRGNYIGFIVRRVLSTGNNTHDVAYSFTHGKCLDDEATWHRTVQGAFNALLWIHENYLNSRKKARVSAQKLNS